jgi:spore maturation protein CgeB
MGEIEKLAQQMKLESERGLGADVRLAAGQALGDESLLWQSGERDFGAIAKGVPTGEGLCAVEIGCRVGRMLRAASKRFGRVIGVDLSELSINKARALIGPNSRVELALSAHLDLRPIPGGSVDFIWSFSALSTMPPLAVASYLTEARRILKPEGIMRLQLFLGDEIVLSGDELLRPRCYGRAQVREAFRLAGFSCSETQPVLPLLGGALQAHGIETFLLTLRPSERGAASLAEIASALEESREGEMPSGQPPPDIETLATIEYASAVADEGDEERAKRILAYVDTCCRATTIDVRDILDRVLARTAQGARRLAVQHETLFAANMQIVREKFPRAYEALVALPPHEEVGVRVTETIQGPVVWRESTCLDHPDKPVQAAAAWVSRALQDKRLESTATIVVVGFGGGYHVEELQKVTGKPVTCYEPSVHALRAALSARDLTSCLRNLSGLEISPPDMRLLEEPAELIIRPYNSLLDAEAVKPLQAQLAMKRGLSTLHPRIAVLGPLQGGTIPTGYYTQGALGRLGQRSRGLDMSGFNKGYELLDELVRGDVRRAVARSAYVDSLTTALIENFEEKPIDVLICMAQAPASPRFLTEMRKRGVITVLWFVEDYLRFTYWRDMAKFYDFVFTIQKGECLEVIRKAGAGEVHYLPTACDPLLHRPIVVTPEESAHWGSEVSFVGAGYHNRQQMFASLAHLPFKIWGSEWPTCRPFSTLVQEEGRRISPEEYIKIFNASAINLNLHSSSERDGVEPNGDFINPRTFELAACGAFQLVDERTLLSECFEPGRDVVTFKDLPDLLAKIEHYRAHPEERAAIAERSRARALREHTYEKRIEQMLGVIYASKFQQLTAREQASPWSKMIERSKSHEELSNRCLLARERGEQPTLDALASDIVSGRGKLSETEQKLMFLFHVKKHILRPSRTGEGA